MQQVASRHTEGPTPLAQPAQPASRRPATCKGRNSHESSPSWDDASDAKKQRAFRLGEYSAPGPSANILCAWRAPGTASGLLPNMSTCPVCRNLPRLDFSKHGSLTGHPSCKVQFHGPTKPLSPPSRTCLRLGNTREERWQRRTGPGTVARSPRVRFGRWRKQVAKGN